jgi:hypothetical protein
VTSLKAGKNKITTMTVLKYYKAKYGSRSKSDV